MTFEKLLNFSADEAEKLTPAELKAFFAPYLSITRPERVVKTEAVKHKAANGNGTYKQDKFDLLNKMLREKGLAHLQVKR